MTFDREVYFEDNHIKFRSEAHAQQFWRILGRMQNYDPYHLSAAYLIALGNLVPDDVFDFEKHQIRHTGLFKDWQTGSTKMITRLMFSLWNCCYQDYAADNPENTSMYYTVDQIFSYEEFSPWFYEAIRIRFERICVD
jgi:hypothetical protein